VASNPSSRGATQRPATTRRLQQQVEEQAEEQELEEPPKRQLRPYMAPTTAYPVEGSTITPGVSNTGEFVSSSLDCYTDFVAPLAYI
jgi:hypothetical protein